MKAKRFGVWLCTIALSCQLVPAVALAQESSLSGVEVLIEEPLSTSSSDEATSYIQIWRLYNPNSGEHFYTWNAGERDLLIKAGWSDEGKGWKASKISLTPVYRLYNPNGGDHHYTTSAGERDLLIEAGWRYEGIGWYSDDAKGVAVHRLYNPNAATGAHHFTTSGGERDLLVKAGWNYENIGWYGVL
ncbi:MAG: hypothetical protein Q4B54_03545 [Coriobacteriales bacterium]|nr:hypothetical protein [Coriobacteriales bacterium]